MINLGLNSVNIWLPDRHRLISIVGPLVILPLALG